MKIHVKEEEEIQGEKQHITPLRQRQRRVSLFMVFRRKPDHARSRYPRSMFEEHLSTA